MTRTENVWIIDDDHAIRWVLEKALQRDQMSVTSFENGNSAMLALQREQPDAIIADIRMPGIDGLTLLKRIHEQQPELPIIIMTAHSDLDSAVAAYQGGAFEYLPKPFDVNEAVALVRRACDLHRQQEAQNDSFAPLPEIVGEAPAMQEVFRAIGRLSRSHINVLITGESGTGKELVAQALHRHSPRSEHPFIAINTAAIPKDLLESELFGHERGAFTGAQNARSGRFEQANGGTLFLDEIGDMPSELQTRLLRVLAEGEFYRVGGHTPTRVNVRVIAATHQDLRERVKAGLFREDLFHRLNVIHIQLPSLRQRREDVPLLLKHFMKSAAEELAVESKSLRPEVEKFLCELDWPGNVRQLENLCRWLTVMASGRDIHLDDLPDELREQTSEHSEQTDWEVALRQWAQNNLVRHSEPLLDAALPVFERALIDVTLKYTGGHRQQAARLLGWGRNTLTRKIKELDMES
jgi:two-component system nitrogen regulation response regulator GlnG